MSKPSAKTKRPREKPDKAPKDPQPAPTHIMLPLADAQKMLQLLGEVPAKYGTAWVMDTLRKAPGGTVYATEPPVAQPPTPAKSPE